MLTLIDLDIPELGYTQFISAWLYQGTEATILVDPGPACTTGILFDELDRRGVDRLDWIFLTHIHLDHGGGVGHVCRRYKGANIACHEKAVHHLAHPARLWEGSLKVLGKVARIYGEMLPVPEENIAVLSEIPVEGGVRVIPTPGHAPHHQCFVFQDALFCGEAFGIFHALDNAVYLRPATPPVFSLPDCLASMDALRPWLDRPLCFGHHGRWANGPEIFETARSQLLQWVAVIRRRRMAQDALDIPAIIEELTLMDPVYARRRLLDQDIRERERYFSGNTIAGILQYLEKTS